MNEPLATSSPISSRVDPDSPTFMCFLGRKGSGKSVLARAFWDTWPGDQLCIDVTRDALTPADVQETFSAPIDQWPSPAKEEEPVRIRYTPDSKSPTFLDDVDRVVGLSALKKRSGGCLLWVDEMGMVNEANRTRPHMRHLLHSGRHDKSSALLCMPRPIGVDPLALSQSDVVYVFDMPNPADCKRVADVCGINPREFDEAMHSLGKFEYLRWDGEELVAFPPLPLRRLRPPGRDHELEHDPISG